MNILKVLCLSDLIVTRKAGPEGPDRCSVEGDQLGPLLPCQICHKLFSHQAEHQGQEESQGQGQESQVEEASPHIGLEVACTRPVILSNRLINKGSDVVTVSLQAVQRVLDCLLDRLLNVLAHFVDLVHAPDWLIGIGYVDGWHVEASPVQAGPLAQLLQLQIIIRDGVKKGVYYSQADCKDFFTPSLIFHKNCN